MAGLFLLLALTSCGDKGSNGNGQAPGAAARQATGQQDATSSLSGDALNRGLTLLRRGRFQEAVTILEEGARRQPDDAALSYYLARALHADTKLGLAEEAYLRALELDPGLGEGWLRLSEIYVEQGRLDDALAALRSLAAARGRGPALDYQEGFVLSKMGRFDEADGMLERSLQARQDNPHTWYIYGVNAQRAGDDARAAEAFKNVLRLDAGYADAWFNLGNALARLGRSEDAQDALQRFAAVNVAREEAASTASNLRVLRKGAEMALEAGDLDRVQVQVAEAEKIRPAEPWVRRVRGELALARGEGGQGLELLHEAAALNSRDADEQLALAAAFAQAGDEPAAARHRQQAEILLQSGMGRQP